MQNFIRTIFICLSLIILPKNLHSQSLNFSKADQIFLEINKLLSEYKTPGVSIVILDSFKVVYAKGFGKLNINEKTAVNPATIFQSASIGKSITAVALMYYVEKGFFNLDENVNIKLRSWKLAETEFTQHEKVTLRRLLSHTAGVNVHGFDGYYFNQKLPDLLQVLDGKSPANSEAVKVINTPGNEFDYSGGGYLVIQKLMEDVLNKPFEEIVGEAVFKRINMNNTFYAATSEYKNTAFAHDSTGNLSVNGKYHKFIEYGAGAGLWTTAEDLSKFVLELIRSYHGKSNILLSQKSVKKMFKAQNNAYSKGFGSDYGLGFYTKNNGAEVFHGGSNDPGYEHMMYFYPELGKGAIILTNGFRGSELWQDLIIRIAQKFEWQ